MATYREDMRKAWERINLFPTQRLQTRLGTVEYADQGEGTPLLVSHGVLGCHVDTVDGWWANCSALPTAPTASSGSSSGSCRRRTHG